MLLQNGVSYQSNPSNTCRFDTLRGQLSFTIGLESFHSAVAQNLTGAHLALNHLQIFVYQIVTQEKYVVPQLTNKPKAPSNYQTSILLPAHLVAALAVGLSSGMLPEAAHARDELVRRRREVGVVGPRDYCGNNCTKYQQSRK